MTADGVIPQHEPPETRRMQDIDGVPIAFTVNRDGTVRVQIGNFGSQTGAADLDKEAREEFMRLWCEAERQTEASVPP